MPNAGELLRFQATFTPTVYHAQIQEYGQCRWVSVPDPSMGKFRFPVYFIVYNLSDILEVVKIIDSGIKASALAVMALVCNEKSYVSPSFFDNGALVLVAPEDHQDKATTTPLYDECHVRRVHGFLDLLPNPRIGKFHFLAHYLYHLIYQRYQKLFA